MSSTPQAAGQDNAFAHSQCRCHNSHFGFFDLPKSRSCSPNPKKRRHISQICTHTQIPLVESNKGQPQTNRYYFRRMPNQIPCVESTKRPWRGAPTWWNRCTSSLCSSSLRSTPHRCCPADSLQVSSNVSELRQLRLGQHLKNL